MTKSESHVRALGFGPYAVVSEMGRGGTGIVYKCTDRRTGALVALKVSRDTSRLQRDFTRKEIAMLGRLARAGVPGVVRVLEHGMSAGSLWYAMELVDGVELGYIGRALWRGSDPAPLVRTEAGTITATVTAIGARAAEREPRTAAVIPPRAAAADGARPAAANGLLPEVLGYVARIASTLAAVHGEGILHGDLNPRNILVRGDGQPMLVDFGTALYTSEGRVSRELAQIEGRVHGTPGYMAPEQMRGDPLDARCDLYALGVILYELVSGRPPFESDDTAALARQHLALPPAPPSRWVEQIPPALDRLILALLEKDPRRRIPYALDLLEALAALSAYAPPLPRAPVRNLYRPRLAGRSAALARAGDELARTRQGQSRGYLLLIGESGVGRTRLLNEIGSQALAARLDVVAGSCADLAPGGVANDLRGPGLTPFRPCLQRLADALTLPGGGPVPEDLRAAAAALAPYEPALEPVAAGAPLPALPAGLAQARVLGSLARALTALAAPAGLVVLLDDLQWADDLTLAFFASDELEALSGHVLIVATCRKEDAPSALAARLAPEAGHTLGLAPLEGEELATLVTDMLATALPPEGVADFLLRQSDGNPLLASEALRSAVEAGLVRRDANGEWSAPGLAGTLEGPSLPLEESLRALFTRRCAELGPRALATLDLAATLGRQLSSDVLATVGDAASGLDELVARRILEEIGAGEYRFVHDGFRKAHLASLAPERRRALHAAVASALEAKGAVSLGLTAADATLGTHWLEAGERARAAPYLLRAAEAAAATFANHQAIELYLRARAALDAGSPALAEVTEGIADLLALAGRHDEARQEYDRALPARDFIGRARLLRKKGKSFWTAHDYDAAEAAFSAAAAALGADGASERLPEAARCEWIEIQHGRFWLLYFARRLGPASTALLDKMAPVVERFATPGQRAMYYQCRAANLLEPGRYQFSAEAIALNRAALAIHEADPRSFVDAIEARFDLAFGLTHGDAAACAEAVPLFERARRDALKAGDRTTLSRTLVYLGMALRRLGRVTETAATAKEALAAAERARITPYVGACRAQLGWVAWRQGDLAPAERLAREALDWWQRGTHRYAFRWLALLPLLALHTDATDRAEARADLEALLEPSQQIFPPELQAALVAARASDADPAACERAVTLALARGYL